jgi:transcriptional regulator with XRE-family HTH domain
VNWLDRVRTDGGGSVSLRQVLRRPMVLEPNEINNIRPPNPGRGGTVETEDFRANLKFLCGHYKSVAEVCRRVEINRQQFNKYLGGKAAPSPYNLRKICAFFGVDEGEIYEPHDEFTRIFAKPPPPADDRDALDGLTSAFFPDTTSELRKYLGYYFAYVVTPSRPGYVLKSITRLFDGGGVIKTKTFEAIRVKSNDNSLSFVNKYRGFCFKSSNIIYLIENEYISNRGFIYTALYPSYRSSIDHLNGLVLGISGGNFRMPYSSQIVFEYLGEEADLRAAIGSCGFVLADGDELSESVKSRLLVPTSPTDFNIAAPIF